MKRKLSITSSEAGNLDDNDRLGGVDEQVQLLSALEFEQNTGSVEAAGFILSPYLARSLGMQPGEMLFRSMFYDTPQAPLVSGLVAQLLDKQEELLRRGLGEGTSSATQHSTVETLNLIESNAMTIQALMDSMEGPAFTVAPELHGQVLGASEAVGGVDIMHGRVPSVPEQSTGGSDGGFVLTPDLLLELGMQPDQVLRRSMFYGTPRSDVVLGIVSQLLEIRENLLCNQELERSGAIQERIGVDCEDTATLIATNEELMRALMASIEPPSIISVPAVVVGLEGESLEEDLVEVLEEGRLIEIERAERIESSNARLLAEQEARKASAMAMYEEIAEKARLARLEAEERDKKIEEEKKKKIERNRRRGGVRPEKAIDLEVAAEICVTKQELRARALQESRAEKARLEEERKAERERLREARKVEKERLTEARKVEKERLKEARKAEKARLEEERKAEKARLEEERKAEKARLEEERKAEKARLEEERKAEKARLEEEKEAEKERWNEKVVMERKREEMQLRRAKETWILEREYKAREAQKSRAEKKRLKEETRAKKAEKVDRAMQKERERCLELEKERAESIERSKARILAEHKVREARVRSELAEEREIVTKTRELELELWRAMELERSGEVEIEERAGAVTEEELELWLVGVRGRERDLGLELGTVRAHAMNLGIEICAIRVMSGATVAEIEMKRDRLKDLNRDKARARIRELQLEIELSKARLRARGLVLELERLRAREPGRD
ncbi:hypothetical protein [Candidatus Ichthyocystis sparus]|uniref:hypothetical protein n=1 Tax=Candidatus Ichthyocystis sparus TaxID=1561004 RepID=UPI000B0D44BF|nr:hypothetical protein [Candidatus Ichthyocystis sparus]